MSFRQHPAGTVLLVLHVVAMVVVGAYTAVAYVAGAGEPDANIGLGLGFLAFGVMGLPWSLLAWPLVEWPFAVAVFAAALLNLVLHWWWHRRRSAPDRARPT